jgi:hypothetical protein
MVAPMPSLSDAHGDSTVHVNNVQVSEEAYNGDNNEDYDDVED